MLFSGFCVRGKSREITSRRHQNHGWGYGLVSPLAPARQVATLTEPNVYSDGSGLYLRVRPAGRSWFFIGAFQGKRIELGLGSALDVT